MCTHTVCYGTAAYNTGAVWGSGSVLSQQEGGELVYKPSGCSLDSHPLSAAGAAAGGAVQIARGSGATVGNSVVMPSTERAVAFSVDDCSPKPAWAISATSTSAGRRATMSPPSTIAPPSRLGDDPPTKNSDYRDYDGSWSRHVVDSSPTPFNLGAGCEEAPLWRVNRNPPQFRSGDFALDPKAASRLDPRATAAMVAAAALDPVPPRIVDGVATRRDARTTWMLDSLFYRPDAAAVDGSTARDGSTNGSSASAALTHPGAFGPTHALPWFARVEADGDFGSRTRGATITPLTRSDPDPGYATMAAFADDACDGERLGEVAVRRGACYEVPDWIQAGDSPLSRLLPEEMHSTTSRGGLHLIATSHTGTVLEAAVVNGKAVFAPFDAPAVYVVDLSTMETSIWDLPDPLGTTSWKFRGAAAANGKVIFAPYTADAIGVFDPNDFDAFEAISITVTVTGSNSDRKFQGATLANNGLVIFGAPVQTAWECSTRAPELPASGNGAVNAVPDAHRFYEPHRRQREDQAVPGWANGVGVWDPNNEEGFSYVDISAPSSTVDLGGLSSFVVTHKFMGGASASNGKVVFAPYAANGVGVFDPNDNSFVLVDISAPSATVKLGGLSGFTGPAKFGAAAAASSGKVIFAPSNAEAVGVFDLSDNSFELEQDEKKQQQPQSSDEQIPRSRAFGQRPDTLRALDDGQFRYLHSKVS